MESLKYYLPSFIVNDVLNVKTNVNVKVKVKDGIVKNTGVIGQINVEKEEYYKNIDGSKFNKEHFVYIKEKDIGKIIGYGGLVIKEIRKESNTTVKISKDAINGMRMLTIKGTKKNVENCKKIIENKLC